MPVHACVLFTVSFHVGEHQALVADPLRHGWWNFVPAGEGVNVSHIAELHAALIFALVLNDMCIVVKNLKTGCSLAVKTLARMFAAYVLTIDGNCIQIQWSPAMRDHLRQSTESTAAALFVRTAKQNQAITQFLLQLPLVADAALTVFVSKLPPTARDDAEWLISQDHVKFLQRMGPQQGHGDVFTNSQAAVLLTLTSGGLSTQMAQLTPEQIDDYLARMTAWRTRAQPLEVVKFLALKTQDDQAAHGTMAVLAILTPDELDALFVPASFALGRDSSLVGDQVNLLGCFIHRGPGVRPDGSGPALDLTLFVAPYKGKRCDDDVQANIAFVAQHVCMAEIAVSIIRSYASRKQLADHLVGDVWDQRVRLDGVDQTFTERDLWIEAGQLIAGPKVEAFVNRWRQCVSGNLDGVSQTRLNRPAVRTFIASLAPAACLAVQLAIAASDHPADDDEDVDVNDVGAIGKLGLPALCSRLKRCVSIHDDARRASKAVESGSESEADSDIVMQETRPVRLKSNARQRVAVAAAAAAAAAEAAPPPAKKLKSLKARAVGSGKLLAKRKVPQSKRRAAPVPATATAAPPAPPSTDTDSRHDAENRVLHAEVSKLRATLAVVEATVNTFDLSASVTNQMTRNAMLVTLAQSRSEVREQIKTITTAVKAATSNRRSGDHAMCQVCWSQQETPLQACARCDLSMCTSCFVVFNDAPEQYDAERLWRCKTCVEYMRAKPAAFLNGRARALPQWVPSADEVIFAQHDVFCNLYDRQSSLVSSSEDVFIVSASWKKLRSMPSADYVALVRSRSHDLNELMLQCKTNICWWTMTCTALP